MAVREGTKLGPYEIISLIGAGGMGEVYRARDPRLNREVAIKVLPADRVSDEDRRRRFIQEAHAASALNHPHIITIHEIESANGHDFIVMEYVRGKSLDVLIPRHGMRLGEVLRIAIPVADALAAAHARGIIHRDLKPANVMVGTDGAVKVLDFGLAKLSGSDDADEDQLTLTADVALSAPGTVAGTIAYMSPEQATGAKVDARSDIFSFGALLYEMATGERAFAGKTLAQTLSAVMEKQPTPPSTLVASLPHDLERTILRCLRKDPAKRFQTMADVRIDLAEIREESESGARLDVPARPRWRWRLVAAVAGTVIVIAATWLLRPHHEDARPELRIVPLTSLNGEEYSPTFSPDGDQVAFSWNGEKKDNFDIYVKIVGSSEVRRLTTDPEPDLAPSWSPDGRQIAYVRAQPRSFSGRVRLMSSLGGSDRKVSDLVVSPPIAWTPDSRYIAAGSPFPDSINTQARNGIYLIPAAGGEPRPITRPNASGIDQAPAFSGDGRRLAYASCANGCDIYVVDLDSAFSVTGRSRRLTQQASFWIQGVTWSPDGKSVIYGVSEAAIRYLWRVGIESDQPPVRIEVAGINASEPAISPSRHRLAFAHDLVHEDLYRFQPGRVPQPVLSSSYGDASPQLSPDGGRITFCSNRSGDAIEIWVAEAGGAGARQLTHGPSRYNCSPHWSPDGRHIAFDSRADDGSWHIWTIDADGGTPQQVTKDPGSQNVPTWSGDGQSIYFSWDQGSGPDIWRIHLADGAKKRVTSGGGGLVGRESADGKSLLYLPGRADSPLVAVPLTGGVARQLTACVRGTAFTVVPTGVYYVGCDPADAPVHVINPATGEDRLLGTLEKFYRNLPSGFTVSADGTTILYTHHPGEAADLMLIENFR